MNINIPFIMLQLKFVINFKPIPTITTVFTDPSTEMVAIFLLVFLLGMAFANNSTEVTDKGLTLYLHHNKVNWYEANKICAKKGMQLYTISNEDDSLAVMEIAQATNISAVWVRQGNDCLLIHDECYKEDFDGVDCEQERPFLCHKVNNIKDSSGETSQSGESQEKTRNKRVKRARGFG